MRSEVFSFAFLLFAILMLVALVPTFFYLDQLISSEKERNRVQLENYSSSLIREMHIYQSSGDEVFIYPRSPLFTSAIYNENKKEIFSLLDSKPPLIKAGFFQNGSEAYLIRELEANIFEAKYLVVATKTNQAEIYFKMLTLFGVLAVLFFVGSHTLISRFAREFDKLRAIEEQFYKDTMHEIKTPLGIISINLELLGDELANHKSIKRIKYALKTLSVVYEDIEHFLRRKFVTYSKENLDFSYFLESRIDYFQDVAQVKGVEIISEIEQGIEIEFSRSLMQRLIDNNLSNAIKYSHENSTIWVRLQATDQLIRLEFEDNGVGISDTKKIFSREYQENSIKGGFGIGLNIVREICDKNGVKIDVVSQKEQGSIFGYSFKLLKS